MRLKRTESELKRTRICFSKAASGAARAARRGEGVRHYLRSDACSELTECISTHAAGIQGCGAVHSYVELIDYQGKGYKPID